MSITATGKLRPSNAGAGDISGRMTDSIVHANGEIAMKRTSMEKVNSSAAVCCIAAADTRLLEEAELASVSGGLAVMTEPVKWYHVGGGLFLGFNEKSGLWAGWGHLK